MNQRKKHKKSQANLMIATLKYALTWINYQILYQNPKINCITYVKNFEF